MFKRNRKRNWMPNRIFAIRYNNTDSLVHLFFTEEYLTINLLNSTMAEEVGFSSFTVDHEGNLVKSLSPLHTINVEAALELYKELLKTEGDYLNSLRMNSQKSELAKAG